MMRNNMFGKNQNFYYYDNPFTTTTPITTRRTTNTSPTKQNDKNTDVIVDAVAEEVPQGDEDLFRSIYDINADSMQTTTIYSTNPNTEILKGLYWPTIESLDDDHIIDAVVEDKTVLF